MEAGRGLNQSRAWKLAVEEEGWGLDEEEEEEMLLEARFFMVMLDASGRSVR